MWGGVGWMWVWGWKLGQSELSGLFLLGDGEVGGGLVCWLCTWVCGYAAIHCGPAPLLTSSFRGSYLSWFVGAW